MGTEEHDRLEKVSYTWQWLALSGYIEGEGEGKRKDKYKAGPW
jgi:hypothetical protein